MKSIKNYKYDMENRYRKLFASISKVKVSWYLCKLYDKLSPNISRQKSLK